MSINILVVEDEAIIGDDIQRLLRKIGYAVPVVVASGEEALDEASRGGFQLALMDIRLQGRLDGIDTAQRLREHHHLPVVYLTSHSDDGTLARAKQTAPYGYIVKPFSERDLRTTIEVALGRRELEEKLAAQERLFSTAIRSLGDALITTDPRGQITSMNPAAERLTGWPLAEARDKHIQEVFCLKNSEGAPIQDPLLAAMRQARAVGIPRESYLVHRDGSRRWVDDAATPIVDEAGRTLGGVIVFRDVTEQRVMERRLAASERMASLGTMISGLAHEINNPLAYVVSNVEYVMNSLEKMGKLAGTIQHQTARTLQDEITEYREALSEANQGADRVRQLVIALRKFSRTDDTSRGQLTLPSVVEEALRFAESTTRLSAQLTLSYGPSPTVEANQGQLAQVFTNILLNAVQAFGDRPIQKNHINICTGTDAAGNAWVEVQDNGPGLPPHQAARVFDPFFTTKPIGEGMGLGLAIAYQTISALGGEITFQSAEGTGTTVRVLLPPAVRPAPAPQEPAPRLPRPRSRVLVIDDEPMITRSITRILGEQHEVHALTSARAALDLFTHDARFDVILCDFSMPNLSGGDFFEELLAHWPALAPRVVFITGGALAPSAHRFLASVKNPILEKPFTNKQLREIVEARLAEPKGVN